MEGWRSLTPFSYWCHKITSYVVSPKPLIRFFLCISLKSCRKQKVELTTKIIILLFILVYIFIFTRSLYSLYDFQLLSGLIYTWRTSFSISCRTCSCYKLLLFGLSGNALFSASLNDDFHRYRILDWQFSFFLQHFEYINSWHPKFLMRNLLTFLLGFLV